MNPSLRLHLLAAVAALATLLPVALGFLVTFLVAQAWRLFG